MSSRPLARRGSSVGWKSRKKTPIIGTKADKLENGSLVWAKVKGFPNWPCIVCRDPVTGSFKTQRNNKIQKVHILYLEWSNTRSWVQHSNIVKYDGAEKFIDENNMESMANRYKDAFHNAIQFADELRGLGSDEERKEKALYKYGWDLLPVLEEENCRNYTSPNSDKQGDVPPSCRKLCIRIEKLKMKNLAEELNPEKEKNKEDVKVQKFKRKTKLWKLLLQKNKTLHAENESLKCENQNLERENKILKSIIKEKGETYTEILKSKQEQEKTKEKLKEKEILVKNLKEEIEHFKTIDDERQKEGDNDGENNCVKSEEGNRDVDVREQEISSSLSQTPSIGGNQVESQPISVEKQIEILHQNVASCVRKRLDMYWIGYADTEPKNMKIRDADEYTKHAKNFSHLIRDQIKDTYKAFNQQTLEGITLTLDNREHIKILIDMHFENQPIITVDV